MMITTAFIIVSEFRDPDHAFDHHSAPADVFNFVTNCENDTKVTPKGLLRWLSPLLLRSLSGKLVTYFGLLKSYLETHPD